MPLKSSGDEYIQHLGEGYERFRKDRYTEERHRFEELSRGQTPHIMILGCADSRVAPEVIFAAAPGELFVVRNVANLVPPSEEKGDYHGTTAAIEFAVNGLRVEHIIIMGHSGCGGIKACLSAGENRPIGRFIAPWVELAAPARDAVRAEHPDADPATFQQLVELEAVRRSIDTLESMPFLQTQLFGGSLKVHGAWFSIAEGQLRWLNRKTGDFEVVPRIPVGAPDADAAD
jgi:carbonic anhydrase